jgi:hypothetical protein
MKRKIFITTLLLSCCAICFAIVADLNGKWSAVFNAPDGNQYPLTYTVKVDGDKLTGTLDAAGMSVPIDNGMVKGDSIKFSVTVQGTEYVHKGKYYAAGDSVAVDVTFEGNKGHNVWTRAK